MCNLSQLCLTANVKDPFLERKRELIVYKKTLSPGFRPFNFKSTKCESVIETTTHFVFVITTVRTQPCGLATL